METIRRDEPIFGDSSYPIPTVLLEGKQKGLTVLFCVKGKRNQPLSEDLKFINKHLQRVQKLLFIVSKRPSCKAGSYPKFVRE
ncbi:hypothetical protein [Leptospira alstonii]|uniref:Transposase, IS4-like family protein n=2 Tax=Leptospira alstonii TaxID=28452 RepID=M6CZI2_9LEPT|nr:hypothetical protein [Leptospira alstonii]EMJ94313.1 hypothetical protein LEP1GSC194_3760 [Leptospira alstonii serovar Sichuan str. 79601]EQA81177.1 hypothetical protein LEP1GSC193_3572 [Leptospira alstonii serovar Pingchang str. 80-412]